MRLSVGLFVVVLLGGCVSSGTQGRFNENQQTAAERYACRDVYKFGIPGTADQYLCCSGYAVGYGYKTKQPRWVAYSMNAKSAGARIKRKDEFRADSDIPSQYRAQLADYRKSGYDRGHLAPYAAMDFSKQSATQSFLLSNISPQKAGLNRQGWAKLESSVRYWA